MDQDQTNQTKQSSAGTMVLVAILMLLIGGGIGYYVTKTYYPTKETVTVEVPIVEEQTTDTTEIDNWKDESEKVVENYLGKFGNGSYSNEKLRTSNFNTFIKCVQNSKQAKDPDSNLFINADIVLGAQDWPIEPNVEIISSEKKDDQVVVEAKVKDFGIDGKIFTFYLTQEKNPISGSEEWLINNSNITIKINPSDYGCSR